MDMSMIDAIKEKYPEASIVINVNLTYLIDDYAPAPDPEPDPEPDPVPGKIRYEVNVYDKPSKRAKVRPTANAGVGEIDYVNHGEIVLGPGRTVGEFTYIDERIGTPLVGPGFVESKYLTEL